jgi:hypothetical protein
MAGGAGHAVLHVHMVIEIDIVRQPVDPRPHQWLVRREALPHWRQHLRVGPHLRVAGHADLGGRHGRLGAGLDADMAEATIDAEFAGVMLMAERYGLFNEASLPCDVPGAWQRHDQRHDGKRRKHQQKQRNARDAIRSRAEKLRQIVGRPLAASNSQALNAPVTICFLPFSGREAYGHFPRGEDLLEPVVD